MAQKQFLHELLKEDQEPFRLKNFISDKRSQLKKPSAKTNLQLKKRNRSNNLCKHACFFSFQTSPDVRKSPFFDFPSPAAKSPCKSPNGAVFLHIPSRTAALLVEAAMRIQQKQQLSSRPKKAQQSHIGLGLLGSFMKRLKERSKSKKRAIETNDFNVSAENEAIRISCSCSNRRLSSANWTENNEASTSSCGSECFEVINDDFELCETRFCESPFRFSLRQSPSSSGRRTPEFCSPAGSPSRRVNQENENYKPRISDNVQGEEEEDKEQCSPVSVLDPPFEDDGRESRDADEDDYDVECSYENVQRAKQQLLHRLRRFEKLAELDPIELERKLMEGSDDDEEQGEREESEDDEQSSLYKMQSVDTILTQVINQSSLQCHSRNMSDDMKKLVSDLIVEENNEVVFTGNNEVVMGRIFNKLDSWREVESNTIDMMIGFDFKGELGGWTRFNEQVNDITAEIEVAIYGLLVEELSDELF